MLSHGIALGILSFIGKMAAAADWQPVPTVAGKADGRLHSRCVLNNNPCASRMVDVVVLTLNYASPPREIARSLRR
jgi:hypothetical protein